nr:16S rRNA (guanine(527)-N(7))-methyltransferase RsmG [Parvularcula mediterranea]
MRSIDASEAEAERFSAYDAALVETSVHTNLVARKSLPDRWERHYADSAQLWPLLPDNAENALDFGSGAGFPGMVMAIMCEERRPALSWTLCDSVGKKAAFLAAVAQKAQLDRCQVLSGRVESLARKKAYDLITARAVTALPGLLELATPLLAIGGTMIFPKGQRAQQEVDAAREQWSFELETVASQTDRDAAILVIRAPLRKP